MSSSPLRAQHLVLKNPLAVERRDEVVEIPLKQVLRELHVSAEQARELVAEGPGGARIPIQMYGYNPDVQALFTVRGNDVIH